MNKQVFIFPNIYVFFKHTNYYGQVHPYNYYEWTSYVREHFFQSMAPNFSEVVARPIKMMTSKISLQLFKDGEFGEQIEARFTTKRIKKCSFDVLVKFYKKNGEALLSQTQHTLVFWNSKNGGFAEIPGEIKKAVLRYDEDSDE